MGSGWRVVPIILKIFCCFFGVFLRFLIVLVLLFVVCFSTLGKVFVECPKKYSANNHLSIKCLSSKSFAECKIVFAECIRHSTNNVSRIVKRAFFIL
jgi:hypothetical protein